MPALCLIPIIRAEKWVGCPMGVMSNLPLISRFRPQTRGITCALKSTGVAHSQYAYSGQDIAPVIILSQVLPRSGPHSNLEENKFSRDRPGSSRRFQVPWAGREQDVALKSPFPGRLTHEDSGSWPCMSMDGKTRRWTTLDVDWMWAVVEIAPVASVEPFGIPSRSIEQLRGKATVVLRPWAWRVWVDVVSCDFGPRWVHRQGLTWLLSAPAWVKHSQRFAMSFNVQGALCSPWPCGFICLCFPRGRVFLRGISGYMARKTVVRWSEPWIRNLEVGIRNLEHGTRNPGEVEQQCSRHLSMVSSRNISNGMRQVLKGVLFT
ncbi:hypothetical protein Bca52824_073430 [Brassica carinata]|uniref:Uncharacterized protein n=1 Tax=Brassica carinata TaxID=52824 RepID=A0A8X7Q9U3_BRACI|nr:hypothetical protein Bca52824_073430 [Brassica carinata]